MAEATLVQYKPGIATDLTSMDAREQRNVNACDRIVDVIPEAAEWKEAMMALESRIHNAWQKYEQNK